MKYVISTLVGIALNLQIALGGMNILIIVALYYSLLSDTILFLFLKIAEAIYGSI